MNDHETPGLVPELTPEEIDEAITDALREPTFGLLDFCKMCELRCGCFRIEVLFEPFAVTWPGGTAGLLAYYECAVGHRWTCSWSARRWFERDEVA